MATARTLATPVDALPRTPPLHGLLATATEVTESEDRWIGGLMFRAEFCGTGAAWSPLCTGYGPAASGEKSDLPTPPPDGLFYPYIIEAPVECGSAGMTEAEYVRRARAALDVVTSYQLERELWTGAAHPENPSLVGHAAIGDLPAVTAELPAGASALSPMQALAELNAYLAECGGGGRGMIHATPDLATVWGYEGGAIDVESNRLVTRVKRNYVVAGGGYTGAGPYGQAAPTVGQAWAYATSIVQLRLDTVAVLPATMAEALDRRTNEVVFRGERYAAATWDLCCHAAVLVDLYGD